jgi:hypothetical protein
MDVLNRANLTSQSITEIQRELANQKNLSNVLRWAFSYPMGVFIPQIVADVVVQDEFTHDVIIPWRDGLVLVYDTT